MIQFLGYNRTPNHNCRRERIRKVFKLVVVSSFRSIFLFRKPLRFYTETTVTMPAKKRPVSSVLDLAAKDSEDQDDGSDDDVPLSSLLVSPEEEAEREKDAEFLNDVASLSMSPRNNVVSSDDDAEEGADRPVSGRLRKTSSAVKPPAVPAARGARAEIDFGSSSSDGESEGTESHSPTPASRKKKSKKERKSHAHQTAKSKSKSQSKRNKRRPGLWKLVGKSNKEESKDYNGGRAFEETMFGFYDSWSDGDLPMADFESACEWFTNEFNFHSIGRERGENMGKLHNQAHGACHAPATKAACDALSRKYKEDMKILTNSRRKVQFKLLVGEQPEDKMCAYTRKWRAFQEFRYHSSDRNGDPYTDEYLAHCDDKYKVRSAPHISPFLYLCLLQHECIPYTAKKYILTRSNLFKFAETFKCTRQETHLEEYSHHLPSLCSHLTKMISEPPYKYVFSSDFLSRGYRINRYAAEKMWIIICEPETTTMQDVANAVFTHNPDTGGKPEEEGIFKSLPNDVPGYPFDFEVVRDKIIEKNLLEGRDGSQNSSEGDSNSHEDEESFEQNSDM